MDDIQVQTVLPKESNYKKIIIGLLGLFLLIYIWYFMPDFKGLEPAGKHTLAILAFMVCWWIGEVCPAVVVALLGIVMFATFKVVTMAVAFSGLSNSTEIFLIFAFMMSLALTKTGLGKRIAFNVIKRSNPSYKMTLFMMLFAGLILGPFIPSGTARVILLGSIGLFLLPVFGQSTEKNSNIGRGFFTGLGAVGMNTADPFITGGAQTVLLVGLLAKANINLTYGGWFINIIPLVLIVMVAYWLIIYKVFPPEVERLAPETHAQLKEDIQKEVGDITSDEKKVAIIVGLIVLFWIIGSKFNLDYVIVCLIGVMLMFLPGIRILRPKDIKSLDWGTLLFVGCCLSLGQIVTATKLDTFLGSVLTPMLSSGSIYVLGFKIVIAAMLVHFIIPSALPAFATFIPLIIASCKGIGIDPLVGCMFFQMGYTAYCMVYQQAQVVAAYGFNQFSPNDFLKVGIWSYVVWLALVPVMVWWWMLRGFI